MSFTIEQLVSSSRSLSHRRMTDDDVTGNYTVTVIGVTVSGVPAFFGLLINDVMTFRILLAFSMDTRGWMTSKRASRVTRGPLLNIYDWNCVLILVTKCILRDSEIGAFRARPC
jgi:hypothetical protein